MFTYGLKIYRGTTFTEQMVWTENGEPVDLTQWQAKSQIRSADAVFTLSTDTGEIALGTAGEINITLTTTQTLAIPAGSYSWDLLLMNPQGEILPPILSGAVSVLQGVTIW